MISQCGLLRSGMMKRQVAASPSLLAAINTLLSESVHTTAVASPRPTICSDLPLRITSA
jgi:hypothetical protein